MEMWLSQKVSTTKWTRNIKPYHLVYISVLKGTIGTSIKKQSNSKKLRETC